MFVVETSQTNSQFRARTPHKQGN